MKEKTIAFLAMLSFLIAVVKFAATEIIDLLKYVAVLAHDCWVFLALWK